MGSGRTASGSGGEGGGMCIPTNQGMYFQNLGTNSECEFGEICHHRK